MFKLFKPIIILISLFIIETSFAQKEANIWYFGNHAGLDFSTNPPTAITNTNMNASEGCASIADANGSLLFYTDGNTIWNKTQAIMANGTGLFADYSSTQTSIIIKKPLSNNLYYVFTQGASTSTIAGLFYSIVDMNLAGGNGSVTVKNVTVFTSGTEKLTATKHANDTDVWVLTHDWNNNNFRANLITSNGVNNVPIITSLGLSHNNSTSWAGYMKFSPDGKKIAVALPGGISYNELFDFDKTTGQVLNPLSFNTFTGSYGCEFSGDGKKLYFTGFFDGTINQFDLCAGTNSAIIASNKLIFSNNLYSPCALQLSNNGKIYVSNYGSQNIGIIFSPNLAGLSCNYLPTGMAIGTGTSNLGLPNFMTSFFDKSTKVNVQAQYGFTLCSGEQRTLIANGASTYTWNASQSGYSLNVSPTITTTYTLLATSVDGCVYSTSIVLNVQPCLSLKENELFEFEIFPNPTNDNLTFILNGSLEEKTEILNYAVYDFTGKVVLEAESMNINNPISLNTKNLNNGYYLFILKNQNQVIKKQTILINH